MALANICSSGFPSRVLKAGGGGRGQLRMVPVHQVTAEELCLLLMPNLNLNTMHDALLCRRHVPIPMQRFGQ